MKVFARLRPAIIVAVCVSGLVSACGNQGEGERCDRRNVNADCDDGLICVHPAGVGVTYDVCCFPPSSSQNTTAICITGVVPTVEPDGGADGGTADGGTPDTGAAE